MRPEEGALTLRDHSGAQQEEERPFFPGKDNESHRLFAITLSSFFSLISKCSLSLNMWQLACSLPWLQTPNCNSLLIPNKPILAGEISGSLFVSGQHSQEPRRLRRTLFSSLKRCICIFSSLNLTLILPFFFVSCLYLADMKKLFT